MADKLNIWGGYKHDASGKRTGKATVKEIRTAAAQSSKLTQAERDNRQAGRTAERMATPYRTAADAATADAALGMTNEQIAALYGQGYDKAGGIAGMIAPRTAANAGNATSILSGLVGALPGAGSYDVTSLLSDYTDANAANAGLGGMFAASLGADIGSARAAGIAGALGRRDERSDRLGKEARDFQLQGDTISNDYLKQLSTLLGIRASRENLALAKLQTEAQRLANEKARRGGSGGSGSSGGGNLPSTDLFANLTAADIEKYDPTRGVGTGYGSSAGANAGSRGGSVSGSTSTSQPTTPTPTTPTTQTPTTTTPTMPRPDIYNVPGGQQGAGTPGGRDLWIPPYDRGLGIIVPGHFGTKQEHDEYKMYKRK